MEKIWLHERFDPKYIECEARILLRFLGVNSKKKHIYYSFKLTDRDKRIAKYWGLL
jgi:hypothetical protein